MSADELERQKRKNLLLSYYSTGPGGSQSNGTSLGSGSISTSSAGVDTLSVSTNANSSFNSNENAQMSSAPARDPHDINMSSFEPDLFLKRLIRERTLPEIMEIEDEIVRETRKLDSEMQTLVSENYNKFISATDTIRKMRSDFKKMEEEMENLVTQMGEITEFNEKINSTFKEKREEIGRLSEIDNLLKKLQFLFDLPSRLNDFIVEENYSMAVKYYCKARKTLDHYKHMPSFRGIEDDCTQMISQLKEKLYERLNSLHSQTDAIGDSVVLLTQLGEPMEKLSTNYIARIEKCLDGDLVTLNLNVDLLTSSSALGTNSAAGVKNSNDQIAMDILEFIDYGCNKFLVNLGLTIMSFNQMFIEPSLQRNQTGSTKRKISHDCDQDLSFNIELASIKINELVQSYWLKYCTIFKRRLEIEQNLSENTIIVSAVDRFYRRIQSINKQIPNIDLSVEASNIALHAALTRVNYYLQHLKNNFNECMNNLRQTISQLTNASANNLFSPMTTSESSSAISSAVVSNVNERKLNYYHEQTFKTIVEQIKSVLANLQAFIATDISFSAKVYFNEPFCKDYVRERLLVPYLKYIAQVCKEYGDGSKDPVPYPLFLILAKLCLEFESVAIDYLITLTDEQFFINDKTGVTKQRELCEIFRQSAKLLINQYVKARGVNLSQMIRKSVETRDWINTIEPRNVRAVMKRIIEDFTSIDIQVGELFEAGPRKEKGSDSSRNTFSTKRSAAWSITQNNNMDSKLMNNIQKLFAEKIDIFSPVEFSRVSVLTGIIKLTLKTFLECIRLKTFSKFGLQQIQVDCHYLQLYLWRFVSDENLVYLLLEEVLTSAIQRCIEPVLMEPRVVEVICETV